jgi:ketosteroid isomerase-like protein
MFTVKRPNEMNETFARAFNTRDIGNLMLLYEEDAVLADHTKTVAGKPAVAEALKALLAIPGTIEGRNNFCIELGELALLRADWRLVGPDGTEVIAGSSAEIVRRQPDGRWLYIIDHAVGASLARLI